jgi:hypothetical protein
VTPLEAQESSYLHNQHEVIIEPDFKINNQIISNYTKKKQKKNASGAEREVLESGGGDLKAGSGGADLC